MVVKLTEVQGRILCVLTGCKSHIKITGSMAWLSASAVTVVSQIEVDLMDAMELEARGYLYYHHRSGVHRVSTKRVREDFPVYVTQWLLSGNSEVVESLEWLERHAIEDAGRGTKNPEDASPWQEG